MLCDHRFCFHGCKRRPACYSGARCYRLNHSAQILAPTWVSPGFQPTIFWFSRTFWECWETQVKCLWASWTSLECQVTGRVAQNGLTVFFIFSFRLKNYRNWGLSFRFIFSHLPKLHKSAICSNLFWNVSKMCFPHVRHHVSFNAKYLEHFSVTLTEMVWNNKMFQKCCLGNIPIVMLSHDHMDLIKCCPMFRKYFVYLEWACVCFISRYS